MSHALQNKVVVLYGALRSGTTMVRLMLDGHHGMVCPGERDFMLDHLHEHEGRLTLDRNGLAEDRIFCASGLDLPDNADGTEAFWQMVAGSGAEQEGRILVLVLHRRLDRLLRLCPRIGVIHLLRDGRDVALSSIGMGWAGNTWFGADHWIGTERDWDRHGAVLPSEQVLTLRYEDLLQAPEANLGGLCAFVGLRFDPAMLDYAEDSTYEPVDPSLAYQWKRKQSPTDVAELESKIGDLLTARGYALSGAALRPPGTLRRAQLYWQSKWHVWSVRFERFGYVDPILSRFAQAVGWTGLRHSAQRRIDEKTKAYLK